MPHTNRKKKTGQNTVRSVARKFTHSKREYVENEDGWTHVADKGWKSISRKLYNSPTGSSPSADMTLEEMIKEHGRFQKTWENSSACTELKGILSNQEESGNAIVTNLVCLGLGSLQGLSLEWRRSSHIQLAALLTIQEALDVTSQTILQDPRFTELDKQFLASKGYRVIEDPGAFLHINETTLVYAIHCPLRLFSKIKQGPYPAMIIGNDFCDSRLSMIEIQEAEVPDVEKDNGEDVKSSSDLTESSQSDPRYFQDTLTLIADCEEIEFPQLRHDFTNTKIFWRHSHKADHSLDLNQHVNSVGDAAA